MDKRRQLYKYNRLELGMKPEAAAVLAGFSRKYARAKAYRIERSAEVGMQQAFEEAGLTDKVLAAHAAEGLKATKIQSCDVFVQQDVDGKLKANSNSNDFVEVPDWASRHKYFHSICEITKRLDQAPLIDLSEHTHVTLVLQEEDDSGDRKEVYSDQETKLCLETID